MLACSYIITIANTTPPGERCAVGRDFVLLPAPGPPVRLSACPPTCLARPGLAGGRCSCLIVELLPNNSSDKNEPMEWLIINAGRWRRTVGGDILQTTIFRHACAALARKSRKSRMSTWGARRSAGGNQCAPCSDFNGAGALLFPSVGDTKKGHSNQFVARSQLGAAVRMPSRPRRQRARCCLQPNSSSNSDSNCPIGEFCFWSPLHRHDDGDIWRISLLLRLSDARDKVAKLETPSGLGG